MRVCFGDCLGRAVVTPSGGSPGYTYFWFDSIGSSVNQADRAGLNLCARTYYVEVTDLLDCKDTAEVDIREPEAIVSSADSLEISCFGLCDGKAWVHPKVPRVSSNY